MPMARWRRRRRGGGRAVRRTPRPPLPPGPLRRHARQAWTGNRCCCWLTHPSCDHRQLTTLPPPCRCSAHPPPKPKDWARNRCCCWRVSRQRLTHPFWQRLWRRQRLTHPVWLQRPPPPKPKNWTRYRRPHPFRQRLGCRERLTTLPPPGPLQRPTSALQTSPLDTQLHRGHHVDVS